MFPNFNLWASFHEWLIAGIVFLKKKLKTIKRHVAFLSVDVVGSTLMKIDEDPIDVELDFRDYRMLVEKELEFQDVLSATWTPDGVMACFKDVDSAVAAAQNLIISLQTFNKQKLMKTTLRVRCGVNAGCVLYDPMFDTSITMAEMTSRVIDIAGHMQKQAYPNTIFISKDLLPLLTRKTGFYPTHRKIDGLDAYQWGQGGIIIPQPDLS